MGFALVSLGLLGILWSIIVLMIMILVYKEILNLENQS